MSKEAILNTKIWPKIGLDHAPSTNSRLLNNSNFKAELATQLLLYDRIIIPTNDFGIVPILSQWMGHSTLLDALSSKAIEFIRIKNCLAYTGNGYGLNLFIVEPGDKKTFEWWQTAMFGEIETSLESQIVNTFKWMPNRNIQDFHDLVLSNTSNFHFENDDFSKNIVTESYIDVMETPSLKTKIRDFYNGNSQLKLAHLPDIDNNQVRFSGIEALNDGIDLLLRVAEVNMEIELASFSNDADIFTAPKTEDILNSKIQRNMSGHESIGGLTQLFELTNLPNIEVLVANGQLEFSDIWAARSSESAIEFRNWFRNAEINEARDLEKAYVQALHKIPSVGSLPTKTLRFVLTTGAGCMEPITGMAASAVDNYFVDKWLSGYNPRLFIDEMRLLKVSSKTT